MLYKIKKTRFLAIMVLLCSAVPYLHSQWSSDPAINTMVSGYAEDQREPCIITDGNGGAIVSWRDYRYNISIFGGDIFAQRLDAGGEAGWTADGKQVNATSFNKGHFKPRMTSDGKGNGLIAWARGPLFFYNSDIFAQKLDSYGTRSWGFSDLTISDTTGTESFQQVVSDDSCGMILCYTHLVTTPGKTHIIAQRVDSEGNIKWTKNGVAICEAAESQSNPQLTRDGQGGAIVVWEDTRAGMGQMDIYAQRINAAGEVLWATDGVPVSTYSGGQISPVIVSDGDGGVIITWVDSRSGEYDIYVQRLNGDGEAQWTLDGVPVCNASNSQDYPDIVSDGMGGAIIVWQDDRGGTSIFAQRIDPSGLVKWAFNGVAASTLSSAQTQPVAIEDSVGGVIIAWLDYRSDASGDIYSQRLNANGSRLWSTDGTAICTAAGIQESPCLVSNGNMGAIISWADRRGGTNYDIFAQNIDRNGRLGIISDDDQDGISDFEESGPDGNNPDYDGNSDGSADRLQGNVASFKTYNSEQYLTLAVPEPASLEDVTAIDNPEPDAAGAPVPGSYPYGFFSYAINGLSAGGQVTATLLLHNGPVVNDYYKYGPTPAQEASWYKYNYDGGTGAEINGNQILLYFTDGIRGDSDLESNGIIVDPGGPLYATTSIEINDIKGFELENIYPNPVSNQTIIAFSTVYNTEVSIEVFDLTGRLVNSLLRAQLPEGRHVVEWDAAGVNDGVYILKMTVGNQSLTHKMIKTR